MSIYLYLFTTGVKNTIPTKLTNAPPRIRLSSFVKKLGINRNRSHSIDIQETLQSL